MDRERLACPWEVNGRRFPTNHWPDMGNGGRSPPLLGRVWSIHRALADKHGTNVVGNWREKP